MINATYGGQTYTDVDTLVASDGTNSATVTLTESGVVPTPTGTKTITENGSNIDVAEYAKANVAVPNSYAAEDAGKVVKNTGSAYELVAQSARAGNITVNGTYDTTDNNSVTVDVSGGSATLGTKTITEDGTYNASSDNYDGYSQVIVSVGGGGTVLSGSFQPSEDVSTYTISTLAGTTLNHFLLKASGDINTAKISGKRVIAVVFIDFTSASECFFSTTTNGTGTTLGNTTGGNTTGGTFYEFNRTSGAITCLLPTTNNGGILASDLTYDWFAW